MPRNFSLALKSYLGGQTLALTNIIRIARLDGQVFGFTSLDQNVEIAGLTYLAYTSVDASELASQIGSGVDNMDVIGLIDSEAIEETDLLAGLWDGSAVSFGMYAFERTDLETMVLVTGTIGEITDDGGQFTAEVRSLSQRLSQQFVALTAPLCRVRELFDLECMPLGSNEGTANGTITPAGCRNTRTVTVVTSPTQITFGADAGASTLYRYGRVQWVTGLNAGVSREVKEHVLSAGTAVITLQEASPFAVAVGDTAILEWGCNRSFEQCAARFKNHYNHAGERLLPGNDSLLRVGGRR